MTHRSTKMQESGEIQRLRKKWYVDDEEATDDPESISLEHVSSCTMVVVLEVLTFIACLLVEIWYGGEER
ncbi:hypothetical protein PR048_025023 [Dryococelus australis]|uniref:Uncharacterized protein n=1 Tax=Dryococelus australis TaxID=614101 RepID=A0ABQ9GQ81_9NEOP|nr:hypothetical protein PR048_025023 [Dryococelus australis]